MDKIDRQLAMLDRVQGELLVQAVDFGPKLCVALLILVAGYFTGAWFGRLLQGWFGRLHIDESLAKLMVRIARVAILAMFVVLALQNLGVELLPLIAGLGVAGAGVALAMQGLLSNLAAGFVIIFTRPFKIGEYIAIVGVEGVVKEINLFNTVLGHTDHSRVVVPNRKIIGEILHNYGQIRQVSLTLRVALDADMGRIFAVIDRVLRADAQVLAEPVEQVQIVAIEDDAVRIALCPWVRVSDYVTAPGALNLALLEALRIEGIALAVPRHDIRMLA
jgi:small conductance mechanosensitive channel